MIAPVMAISNLVLTRQIYSEETNGAHAHNRDRVPLKEDSTLFPSCIVVKTYYQRPNFSARLISKCRRGENTKAQERYTK